MPVSARVSRSDLTRTPKAKLMLRLVKGMRMVIRGFEAMHDGWLWLGLIGFFTRATTLNHIDISLK